MVQLKVIVVGASPAESIRLEEALLQAGCLERYRHFSLDLAMKDAPNWDEWDLLIARYPEASGESLLSFLAPCLRKLVPPVFFLIDPFDPVVITRLLNAGARRVLPVAGLEAVLGPTLAGIFDTAAPASIEATPKDDSPASGRYNRQTRPLIQAEDYARIFRTSPVGISINRLRDGKCVDCNESFARLLEWSREDLIGSDSLELGIPADIQKFFELERRKNDGRDPQPVLFERKLFTRSRQIRHVQIHLDQVVWAGEACVISLVLDITEKEQAKEKVKRLNNDLERLVQVRTGALEAANRELGAEFARRKVLEDFSNQLSQITWETPDVVAVYAPDGQMQFLNKAGRALFGVKADGPVGHLDLVAAYPESARDWIREKIQPLVVRDGIWRGETSFQLADGRVIPVSQVLLCKKDEDGAVEYFASIARDITDIKRVEQELRQSHERYRTLAEAAHDFIFMISRSGLMEYANEFACRALGFDPAEVVGIPANRFFPKDFAVGHLQQFDDIYAIDRPVYTEGPLTVNDQEYWMGTWLVPIHNDRVELVSILGISRDITEQKRTDIALQRALQNERKLGEMRSNFFSMTSHQFRTPLSTILLSAELLEKYGLRWDDSKRLEHLKRIQDGAKHLNSLLEDILVIGRAESGRYVSSPKEFDLVSFCAQAIQELATIDRNAHEIIFHHDLETLPVFQDTEVMHRVVDNLLSNAIKYSPSGKRVTVQVGIEDHQAFLEVTDQGIGIPEQDLQFLFQPFQRGSNAADFPGTGIGLTIVQKSIELINGSISLKSKEGLGTTFVVRFPARYETNDR